jgi:hypothetical protein
MQEGLRLSLLSVILNALVNLFALFMNETPVTALRLLTTS